jgi:hemerythrin-like domain-containing protein
MKRHPALAALSRDHHQALVVARDLRRASPVQTASAARAFLAFWAADCHDHFRLEEEILLPAYAVHGSPDHPAVVQMLVDHMIIRRDAALVAGGASAPELRRLGQELASHVRLEERRVFPLVEETLSVLELDRLGHRLAEAMGVTATRAGDFTTERQ